MRYVDLSCQWQCAYDAGWQQAENHTTDKPDRPQLPSLTYLDVEKVKREEDAYQSRHTGATQTTPAVTAASPTYPYPSGPPPPYSQPLSTSQHANAWPAPHSETRTPPDSRRTSREDGDQVKSSTRQTLPSLPSLSEALGVDTQTAYSSTPTHLPSAGGNQSHVAPAPAGSPSMAKRTFAMEPPPAPFTNGTSHTASYPPHPRSDPLSQSAYSPLDSRRPSLPPVSDRIPLPLQTSQAQSRAPPSQTYPAVSAEDTSRLPPTSMAPQSSPFAYGYTPYPPRYAHQTGQAPGANAGPIYQPSTAFPAAHGASTSWRSEEGARHGLDDRNGAGPDYSTSVKRHLDMYDLEGALNEVSHVV